jgi:TolA-binding protein
MFEGVETEVGTASPFGIAPPPPGEPTHAASDAGHPIDHAASPRGESDRRPPHPLAVQVDSGKAPSETADVASKIGTLPSTPDPVRALLKTSDSARMAGHPDQAIVALRAILAKRPHDPRAPYATFMLGRVLLDQMNRPGEAAEVFAAFRARDATSPLAADALAREAECWSRAGDHARAQDRARLYVSLYPHGPQIEAVRALVDGHD